MQFHYEYAVYIFQKRHRICIFLNNIYYRSQSRYITQDTIHLSTSIHIVKDPQQPRQPSLHCSGKFTTLDWNTICNFPLTSFRNYVLFAVSKRLYNFRPLDTKFAVSKREYKMYFRNAYLVRSFRIDMHLVPNFKNEILFALSETLHNTQLQNQFVVCSFKSTTNSICHLI